MKKFLMIPLMLALGNSLLFAQDFLSKKSVAIGKPAADFSLQGVNGESFSLSGLKGKTIMLFFWSAECPFVKRYETRLHQIAADYAPKGVAVYAVDSNKNETPDEIKKVSAERNLNYPVLLDPGSKIADQFGAITTPHVFIIDPQGNLAYEGAVDDQGWSEKAQPKTNYVRDALDALLAGKPVPVAVTKSVGCTVKRK